MFTTATLSPQTAVTFDFIDKVLLEKPEANCGGTNPSPGIYGDYANTDSLVNGASAFSNGDWAVEFYYLNGDTIGKQSICIHIIEPYSKNTPIFFRTT